ncbi:NAD-dependent epimerase/dehydratase family protein [Pseudoalteromonas piscicida]|uniref:NAD-dependent epimerase/dehydratase family protein n=1 Tax=Pseudoalteromonas piscicida TaxID=43662 RepID=UPI001EFCB6B7|nr:NAD-dependent epimerase/dehydratase family protein [Pseudoalteromonas piscicida]MCG9771224.1 NAD-dependent epimerase/dehydratase family protein [Pseudoalteromonas piscicida]
MKVLLTGGTGFLGGNLVKKLEQHCITVTAPVRKAICSSNDFVDYPIFNDIFEIAQDESMFKGVDVLVHTAAIAHSKSLTEESYQKINRNLTIALAKAASKFKLKRFIFISSIGVNGTSNEVPFKVVDKSNPTESYAVSKYEAEIGLRKIAEETEMEVVIIRPPLVYGKGAPGNFGTLLKVAEKNLPLPLGAINNRRSFVAIDNLVDFIVTCIDHPNAANQTFLVSDDEEISTSNLLKKLTLAAGKKPWLIPVPVSFLKFLASIIGKKAAVERFSSSLTVDIEHTKNTLNWKPPITMDEGIHRCFK